MDLAPGLYGASRKRIAVVGSGISGLSAAWLLSKSADVVLFEGANRLGGHSNTVDVETPEGIVPVDTGFIVYNEANYPNLRALFDHFGVKTAESCMSFSASLEKGAFEYSGAGIISMFGQRRNVFRPRFWSMVKDMVRFYWGAPKLAAACEGEGQSLGRFLDDHRFGKRFVEDHILPLVSAIWMTDQKTVRDFQLDAFVRFFANHGLFALLFRPPWRTVANGSRSYVASLMENFAGAVRRDDPVQSIVRQSDGVHVRTVKGTHDVFSDVVVATHADEALALIGDQTERERNVLGAFRYTQNRAVVHSDASAMPQRRAVWSSWNFVADGKAASGDGQSVTYWMNRLQPLPTTMPIFVTLNPHRPIDPQKYHMEIDYSHPAFNAAALRAQRDLWDLQGQGGVWYCGAYFGSGFHEDGLQAGLAVAEAIGGVKRPWRVANEAGRLTLPSPVEA